MGRTLRTICARTIGGFALVASLNAWLEAKDHPPDLPPAAQQRAEPDADLSASEGKDSDASGEVLVPPPAPDEPTPKAEEKKKPAKKKAPPNPFKPNLFQNDFSYKKDPENKTYIPGEELKDMPLDGLGDWWCLPKSTLSFGGELRHRYMDEDNRLRLGGPGRSTYQLWRSRNYLDYKSEHVRAYVEMIDASSFGEELPETIIDVNRTDIQNAFVDLMFLERDGKPIVFRTGRMELQYGAQRLISPLDWANTRRNFEGFLVSSKGDAWDIDAFVTRPVNSAALNHFRRTSADHADASRTFTGVYSTFHAIENQTVDIYWIWLREQEPLFLVPDGSRQTVGLRYAGTKPIKEGKEKVVRQWDWDFEGGYQFGHDNDLQRVERPIEAGFVTGIIGHTWMVPWKPRIAGLYYWGSGDSDRFDGEVNTFSVLYPLGHAYWGILDNLSGQNLINYSVQGQVKPTDKLTCNAHMHWFNLDSNADRIYNVAGAAVGGTGTSVNVGRELDLFGTYQFNPNFDIQAGYSWFWYGDAVTQQAAVRRDDASQLYIQTTLRY